MKKILMLFVLAGFVLSCGTTKQIKTSKKILKGEWLLNSVSYSDYGTFRITFFNDATKNCLEGSTWNFVPNNNSGTYSIAKGGCLEGTRNFIFTIQEVDPVSQYYDFLIKPVDEKKKSADNKGFRLHLDYLSDTEMRWTQQASIDNTTITIQFNFTKTNAQ